MAYGIIKVDTIIFDQGGADQNVTVSGIYRAITSGVTVSGTISGAVLVGTTTVSGTTVTGTTANFASGVFTTQVSGATVTGTQSSFTSGNFVTLSGATATFTSGVIASGTAAAPSLSIVGDGNTGIYSPGADQVAVATNGTGRLFIDANGTVTCTSAQPTDGSIRISNTTTRAPSNKYGIRFADSASETNAAIYAEQASSGNNASALVFGTNDGTGGGVLTSATERLRITSAGLVGIGTTSPGSKNTTQVTSDGDGVRVQYQSTPVAGEGPRLIFGHNTNSGTQQIFSAIKSAMVGGNDAIWAGNLAFYTGGSSLSERLTITSAGNVGIGISSPAEILDLAGNVQIKSTSVSGSPYLIFNSKEGAGGAERTVGQIQAIAESIDGWGLRFLTRPNGASITERARIDSSGRLLVGTSTAGTAKVSIQGATGNSTYTVEGLSVAVGGDTVNPNGRGVVAEFGAGGVADGAATYGATINLGASSVGQFGIRIVPGSAFAISDYYPGGAYVGAANPPTERMRIDGAGRVAINATPTVQQFLVGHNGRDGIAIADLNTSSVQANLLLSNTRAGGTSNYYVLAYANSVNTFIVYSNGNIQNTNNSYGAISDIKLKENIVDATSQWSDIKALQVRKYNFKEGQTHTQIGLVAQEVELVSPGLVSESPDRDEDGNDLGTVTKSVNYSVLYMKAVKALQEAMTRIETLEADVALLKSA